MTLETARMGLPLSIWAIPEPRSGVAGVVREMDLRRDRCAVLRDGRRELRTAYLGGGTPSQLEPRLMADLLAGTVGRLEADGEDAWFGESGAPPASAR